MAGGEGGQGQRQGCGGWRGRAQQRQWCVWGGAGECGGGVVPAQRVHDGGICADEHGGRV